MATAGERTDPRVRRTRELIQRAFIELVQERGFEAIRVQDIAERATINRATFYAHFEDKYSLLDTLIKERFSAEIAQRLPPGSPLSESNLRTLASVIYTQVDELDGHCRPTEGQTRPNIEAEIQRELYSYLVAWLRRAAQLGATHAPEIAVAASAMSWAIFGAALEWSRGARTPAQDVAVRRLVATLVDGVAQTTRITLAR
ncbi:MAG TPA: TetR family transcriptional regulator [Ktedonobacterales bacterium]